MHFCVREVFRIFYFKTFWPKYNLDLCSYGHLLFLFFRELNNLDHYTKFAFTKVRSRKIEILQFLDIVWIRNRICLVDVLLKKAYRGHLSKVAFHKVALHKVGFDKEAFLKVAFYNEAFLTVDFKK